MSKLQSLQPLLSVGGIVLVVLVLIVRELVDWRYRRRLFVVELKTKFASIEAKVDQLEHLSTFDGATGLVRGDYLRSQVLPAALRAAYEAEHMELHAGEPIRIASAGAEPCALLRLDLDGLKRINDTQGHDAGDEWIAMAAEVLRGSLRRGTDVAARLHSKGDEFAVLLRGASQDWAEGMAVAIATKLGDKQISAACAVLSTEAFPEGISADGLMKIADELGRQAKQLGPGVILSLDANGKTRPVWPLDLVEAAAPMAEATADV